MKIHGPPRAHGAHLNAVLLAVAGLGAVLLFALTVGGAQSANPASGRIAFTRADGIYVMRTDGSGVRALRRGGVTAGALDLEWSPDGSKLAFVNPYVADATHGIWVMDANGANLRQLAAVTELRDFGSPTWSADGRRIAYTAKKPSSDNRDIWVVNLDGSHERRLALTPRLWEWEVDWSPAGSRIAFTSLGGYFSHLYVMNTDGSSRHLLNPGWRYEAATADWSPNGRRIAFMRVRMGPSGRSSLLSSEIWVANPNGASRVRLTKDEIPDIYPTWSPDGRKIAFVRGGINRPWNIPSDATEIYVVNADGSELTRLTHNRVGEGYPAWQPLSPS